MVYSREGLAKVHKVLSRELLDYTDTLTQNCNTLEHWGIAKALQTGILMQHHSTVFHSRLSLFIGNKIPGRP